MSDPVEKNLFSPRYWSSWFGLGLLRLITLLPHRAIMSIGRMFGKLVATLAKRRVEIARINLKLCYPDLSEAKLESLLHQYFESVGLSFMDTAISWWWSDRRLTPLVSISGLENLERALEQNKGVLFYTGHFVSVDMSARLLCRYASTRLVYRPNENPVLQQLIVRHREKFCDGTIPRSDVRGIVRTLKSKKGVGFAPDQNYGLKNSVFSNFFGIPAATNTSATRIIEMSGALVLPFVTYRRPDGGYQVVFEPALDDFPGASLQEDADRLNRILEDFVRVHPEQYNWMHRRFKDRPDNGPRFY